MRFSIFSIAFFFLLSGCNQEHMKPAAVNWYFWKTTFTENNLTLAQKMSPTEAVYIRIFDVVWDQQKSKPVPRAPLRYDTLPQKWTPVIFIKNDIFYKLDSAKVDSLSDNLIEFMQVQIPYRGWSRLQLDCDWTEQTRNKYFWLIECMNNKLGKEISSTIRLHQISSIKKMGIPPVSHGVLMCYNMQSPLRKNTANSIYSTNLLKSHTLFIHQYPIQLDIAFPLYTWAVVFRNEKFHTLINEVRNEELNNDAFSAMENNFYKVSKPAILHGFALLENDEIRLEEAAEEDLQEGIDYLLSKMNHPTKLVWYHLDSAVLENRKGLVKNIN